MEKVGAVVQRLRSERGLSILDLARLADLSSSTISRLENGQTRLVSLRALRNLATALGVSPYHFLENVELDLADGDERLLREAVARSTASWMSVFISYGGPDEEMARALNDSLQEHGVETFFFPDDAAPGQRLHRTMSDGTRTHDRILMLCSASSLERPGVLHELEQVLQREAAEGGAELLIPVALDDYVFKWQPQRRDLALQVRSRVILDFRDRQPGSREFDRQVDRLLAVLRLP